MESSFLELINAGLQPHRVCLLNEPGLVYGTAAADAWTGLCYIAISIVMSYWIIRLHRAKQISIALTSIFLLFIFACGIQHFVAAITMFYPAYDVLFLSKLIMAIVSTPAAIILLLHAKRSHHYIYFPSIRNNGRTDGA